MQIVIQKPQDEDVEVICCLETVKRGPHARYGKRCKATAVRSCEDRRSMRVTFTPTSDVDGDVALLVFDGAR